MTPNETPRPEEGCEVHDEFEENCEWCLPPAKPEPSATERFAIESAFQKSLRADLKRDRSEQKPSESDEEAAEKYCDQPRCAQMTRNDKAWHRSKAAFLAGGQHKEAQLRAEFKTTHQDCIQNWEQTVEMLKKNHAEEIEYLNEVIVRFGAAVQVKNEETKATEQKLAKAKEALATIESFCPDGRISIIPQKALQRAAGLARETLAILESSEPISTPVMENRPHVTETDTNYAKKVQEVEPNG